MEKKTAVRGYRTLPPHLPSLDVIQKLISIHYINTKYQVADMFTKPLATDQFNHLKSYLMGTEELPDVTQK